MSYMLPMLWDHLPHFRFLNFIRSISILTIIIYSLCMYGKKKLYNSGYLNNRVVKTKIFDKEKMIKNVLSGLIILFFVWLNEKSSIFMRFHLYLVLAFILDSERRNWFYNACIFFLLCLHFFR